MNCMAKSLQTQNVLKTAFPRTASNPTCWASLIEDVTTNGTCGDGFNPAPELDIWGWSELENACVLEEVDFYDYYRDKSEDDDSEDYYSYDYSVSYKIANGTCSRETEDLLQTDACMRSLAEQPNIIKNTLELLVPYSCANEVYYNLTSISQGLFKKKRKHAEKRQKTTTSTRLYMK